MVLSFSSKNLKSKKNSDILLWDNAEMLKEEYI